MNDSLEKTVETNAAARVMLLCTTLHVNDLDQITAAIKKVKKATLAKLEQKHLGVDAISDLLDEEIARLEKSLRKSTSASAQTTEKESKKKSKKVEDKSKATKTDGKKRAPAKEVLEEILDLDMTKKLAAERKPVQKLLLEDCVQIGLVTRDRAEYLVTQFAGKEPRDAEMEVVIELRNNLHTQIRKFMRKHKGGPWPSPKEQEELRLDIVHTPSITSLLSLTRQILKERQRWINKNSLTGRIFGDRLKLS
jgi:hypothetical protein